jgi:DNA invertase Pin-like site-specific DNA recombinase
MNVVIASRVSTSIQDNKRQVEELKDFSKRMNYNVVNVYDEIISGAKKNEERPELMKMIQFIQQNKVDKVLCWELSRLGRNTIEVLKTIQMFNENKISLYILRVSYWLVWLNNPLSS